MTADQSTSMRRLPFVFSNSSEAHKLATHSP